jgi:hypothetical protein
MAYLQVKDLDKTLQKIYSQDSYDKYTLKIMFDDVELENADEYCENVTIKHRIIPYGSKSFTLDSLISKECEITLHNLDLSILKNKVKLWLELPVQPYEDGEFAEGTEFEIENVDNTMEHNFEYYGNTYQQNYTGKNHNKNAENLKSTGSYPQAYENLSNYDGYDNVIRYTGNVNWSTLATNEMSNTFKNAITNGNVKVTTMLLIKTDTLPRILFYLGEIDGGSSYKLLNFYKEVENGWKWYYTTHTIPTNPSSKVIRNHIKIENYVSDVYVAKIQSLLSDSPSDFEPYVGGTSSPNPDYQQEIQCVEGIQNVNVCGKNLFNKNTVEQGKEISNGNIFNNPDWFVSDYIPIEYGKTYVKNISSGNSCIIYDKDKQKISDSSTQFSQNKITITYENAKYIRINQYISNINSYQFELGNQATTYEEYKTPQNYEVNLEGKNLWNNTQVVNTSDYIENNGTGFKLSKTANGRITPEYTISIPANTSIIITNILKNYTTSNGIIYCQWIATDNTIIWTPNINNTTVNATFNKDIKGVKFYLQTNETNDTYVEIENLMIRYASISDSEYVPYRSPIKLYNGDYITGTPDNWSIVRNKGVIDSYNGETITTDYISTTGGLDTGATIVYELNTPTTEAITDTYLISQLNTLKEDDTLLNGYNNIEVYGDLPLYLKLNYNHFEEITENIPLGVFNFEDKPTTDKDKTTITLRDNSTLLDFPYNAQPLIEENDGTVTKLQIFQDICTKFNIETDIEHFDNDDDEIGIYDNTVNARVYISYLAEQAGCVASFDRDGKLIFIELDDLYNWNLPFELVENYEDGDKYKISRVIYEDAIRKFESGTEEHDTLYLNAANPYISNQEQVDNIFSKVDDFEINSLKTGKIVGNPLIDGYDLISFTDDDKGQSLQTLASYELKYNGVLRNTFETEIGLEKREENVSLNAEPSFRRYAKTNIDNINNNISLIVGEQNEQAEKITQMLIDIDRIENIFQITGGNNMIKDSQLLLKDTGNWLYGEVGNYSFFPSSNKYPMSTRNPIEYYYEEPTYIGGYDSTLIGKTVAIAKIGISNGKMSTSETNITNLIIGSMYTLSYKISNDLNTNTKIKLIGNGNVIYEDTINTRVNFEEKIFSFVAQTSNYKLEIQTTSTTDGFTYIYDLMLNKGDIQTWTPAAGEIVSTIVKLSQLGVQVFSSSEEIATLMTSEGFEVVRYSNGTLYEIITKFTKDGFQSKKGILEQLEIGNYDFKTINYQGYETLVLYKKESGN